MPPILTAIALLISVKEIEVIRSVESILLWHPEHFDSYKARPSIICGEVPVVMPAAVESEPGLVTALLLHPQMIAKTSARNKRIHAGFFEFIIPP